MLQNYYHLQVQSLRLKAECIILFLFTTLITQNFTCCDTEYSTEFTGSYTEFNMISVFLCTNHDRIFFACFVLL